MCILYFLHNLMWHKTHPLPFPWWKETSFWECTEDLNIISLICEVITSWCHQNTAQFGTTDHSNALMWFMIHVCITEEQDFLLFIFQCLGQWEAWEVLACCNSKVSQLYLTCIESLLNFTEFYLLSSCSRVFLPNPWKHSSTPLSDVA